MTPQSIWCVGRNYRDHAQELNNPIPQKPLIFVKSGACITTDKNLRLPSWTSDIHHECEIAVRIGKNAQPEAIALALDLTARDVQNESKKKGEPWTLAKSFTGACPIGPWIPFPKNFQDLKFHLKKNGKIVQSGDVKDMIFPLPMLLDFVAQHFPLQPGDLLLTGTPAGVGPLASGDLLQAEILGHCEMTWNVM